MHTLAVFALNLDTGPFDQLSPKAYIALMGIGFVVGVSGHVVQSKPLVAAGILMIFLATFLLPLAAHVGR